MNRITLRNILIILLVLAFLSHFVGVPFVYGGSFGGILLLIVILLVLGVI